MEKLYFDDFEDFASYASFEYESIKDEDFQDISIVAKYNEMRNIIKELIYAGYDIRSIEIDDEECNGYDSEYVCTILRDEIWCEPMKIEGKYLADDSTITYVLDNCSSKVIPYCKGNAVYEVTIDEYDEYCDCDECDYCNSCDFRDENDDDEDNFTVDGERVSKEEFNSYTSHFRHNEKPATTSTVTYKVNNKECSKEEYEKALNELDEKYLDNVQDMLLDYFDFVSEMNQWRKLLGWF